MAASLTERSLMTMKWKGSQKYKQAERKVWKIFKSDDEVAGYVRQVDDFYQVWRHFGTCRWWGRRWWDQNESLNTSKAWLALHRVEVCLLWPYFPQSRVH